VFVHSHDPLHDFISAEWGRHGGLLRDSRSGDSQQHQRGQKSACVKVQIWGKPNHH
jgi:hypothetical protein